MLRDHAVRLATRILLVTRRLRAERMSLFFITAMHDDAALMATMGGTRDAKPAGATSSTTCCIGPNMATACIEGASDSGALAGRAGLKLALSGKIERVEIDMLALLGPGLRLEITCARWRWDSNACRWTR